jgi:hypothetical protein
MASREQALQEFAETFVHWLSVDANETEESLVAA